MSKLIIMDYFYLVLKCFWKMQDILSNVIFCVQKKKKKYMLGMTSGIINDDRIFIFFLELFLTL